MAELDKKYNFKDTETFWQNSWSEDKVYKWDESLPREENFSIDTPPPTVSGTLHMGHIFSYTQADFVVRYQRMKGKNVFYPMGFDDNGLPTERLVEKKRKIKATQMSREEFISVCQEVVVEEEEKFRQLFNSIALSVDWDQEYQTISKPSRTISQMSFLDLIEKSQLYRDDQPMLWDPVDQTALSQAEIEEKEKPSQMHDIIFKTEADDEVVIATTRPEMLSACVAVFYHPDDERYQKLAGQNAITPLFGVKVPFLADGDVSPEKGTGLVMCCTFGDITDIQWWKTHKLPNRQIIDKSGRIQHIDLSQYSVNPEQAEQIQQQIVTLKVNAARAKMVELLHEIKVVVKSVDLQHVVKCAERSGAPLEILTTSQWFVRSLPHREALLAKSAELKWYPAHMKIRLDQWIEGLTWDWCISRQRYFGVPIPVWYSKRHGEEGKVLLPTKEQLPINPFVDLPEGYSRDEVEPDPDVMDTWATSSVSPQLSSLAINEDFALDIDKHKKIYPFDLRPQAHEIIRTWAFSTILKSHLHEEVLPWKNIMISGWCLSHDKSKMSKSKGNIIDPVDLIDQYGADVIRYWASTSRLGADTAYSEDIVKNGKRLQNKLWNASKFVLQHFAHVPAEVKQQTAQEVVKNGQIYHSSDLWLLSRLSEVIRKATESFEKFEYAVSRELIEKFFWHDFCDVYLELVKVRVYDQEGQDVKGQLSAACTMYHVLKILLKLFAPFMPHLTDELYSKIFDMPKSIHCKGTWPLQSEVPYSESALAAGVELVAFIELVRKGKGEKQVSVKAELSAIEYVANEFASLNSEMLRDLQQACNAQAVTAMEEGGMSSGQRIVDDNNKSVNLLYV